MGINPFFFFFDLSSDKCAALVEGSYNFFVGTHTVKASLDLSVERTERMGMPFGRRKKTGKGKGEEGKCPKGLARSCVS